MDNNPMAMGMQWTSGSLRAVGVRQMGVNPRAGTGRSYQ